MATYYARANGNIDGPIWSTTPSGSSNSYYPFTSSDILVSNSFTITLNVNTIVQQIRNDAYSGATAGGAFTFNNGVVLTANAFSTTNQVISTINTGTTATLIGNISGYCLNMNGGTFNITGNVTGSDYIINSPGIFIPTGVINITGNVYGGGAYGIAASHGIRITGTSTINIIGSVNGGTSAGNNGLSLEAGAGIVTVTGNVNAASAMGIRASGAYAGTINITGDILGSDYSTSLYGISIESAATVNLIGTCTSGKYGFGISNTGGIAYVKRAKGNMFPQAGNASVAGVFSGQTNPTYVEEIEYGDYGQTPTAGPIILTDITSNKSIFYKNSLIKKTLVDSTIAADHPSTNNVRSLVAYGSGSYVGACSIPSVNNVAYGIGVGTTFGTAVLTKEDILNALASFSSGRLLNVATINTMERQISDIHSTQ